MAGITLVATDTLRQMNFPHVHEEKLTSYFVTFSAALWSWLFIYGKRMPLGVENIRLFKSGYKCCSILRTFWTVFKSWDGLARTMTAESIKRTQGQWTVMVLWLCCRSSRKCTSASFYMTSLVTNCKRFFTESRVHRAGVLGTWQWHSAHPVLAALADAAPSVCTRAAVEEVSVTATANSLGWPVSWASTQSGGRG